MQRLFLRMMAGDVKTTEPDFESQAYLPNTYKITAREWGVLVPKAYIWMVRENVRWNKPSVIYVCREGFVFVVCGASLLNFLF